MKLAKRMQFCPGLDLFSAEAPAQFSVQSRVYPVNGVSLDLVIITLCAHEAQRGSTTKE